MSMRLAACSLALLLFAKEFTPPPAQPAASYPMHDTHSNEHVTVAADPFDAARLADAKVKYVQQDLTPIRIIITNDGDAPISLVNLRAELITASRDKVPPATEDDIYRRIGRHDSNPQHVKPIPIPGIGGGKKPRVKEDQQREVESLMLQVKAVEPHSTQSGFLFFDTQGLSDPLHKARLYLTGFTDARGQELLYFEIPLG